MNIKVLLADDHTIVRKGLRVLLDDDDAMEVIAEAEDGHQAVDMARELRPDIVVMDISMPGLNGIEATQRITTDLPATRVVVLTMHGNKEYIQRLFQAGASGYLVKKNAPQELVQAIKVAHGGDKYLSPSLSATVVDSYITRTDSESPVDAFSELTPREREILQLIAEGKSTREAAELLVISVKTVETHRSNLMQKLELDSTVDLIKYAIRNGLISLDD